MTVTMEKKKSMIVMTKKGNMIVTKVMRVTIAMRMRMKTVSGDGLCLL